MKHQLVALIVSLILGGYAGVAGAKQNVNTLRFRPAIGVEGLVFTEGGDIYRHLAWMVGLVTSYERTPVVELDPMTGAHRRDIVQDRVSSELMVALGLWNWIEIGLSLPIVFYQRGVQLQQPANALQTVTIGDLRLAVKVGILRSWVQRVGLSFQLNITAPTAPERNGSGSRLVTLNPMLNFSYNDRVYVGVNLGATVRTKPQSVGRLRYSHELNASLGVGYTFSAVNVMLFGEIMAATQLTAPFSRKEEAPVEGIIGTRWRWDNVHLLVGAGLGLVRGVGVPKVRAFVGVEFSTDRKDTDQDGILDANDRCVRVPEDHDGFEDQDGCPDPDNDLDKICDPWVKRKGLSRLYAKSCGGSDRCPMKPEDLDGFQDKDGCPEPDNDRDGILDSDDKCPYEPEDLDQYQDKDGCPDLDNDGDGILDTADKCPLKAEDYDGYQDRDGCPDRDNDNDNILDLVDQCPNRAEVYNKFEDTDGCPDVLVELTKGEIKIYQKVFFDNARSRIRKRSYRLLNMVAKILREHPEIVKLRVEGHTDRHGTRLYNMRLSQLRARAVFVYLTRWRKISAKRLSYRGYGYGVPLMKGRTAEAYAKNRRVQFKILKRKRLIRGRRL